MKVCIQLLAPADLYLRKSLLVPNEQKPGLASRFILDNWKKGNIS
jgi:hypothetical protein